MHRCLSVQRIIFFIIIMFLFTNISCNAPVKKSADTADAAKIEVSWQMVSNFIEPAQQMEAKFIFTNKGNYTLDDSSWALFYNNTPRGIKSNAVPQPAKVEHMNGDWYRLTPNKGFSLKPGETVEVSYRCDDFVIKETDAPQGLYFVFYEGGKEKAIVDLGDAKVLPFTTREQQLRGKGDREQVYTPALEYAHNSALADNSR